MHKNQPKPDTCTELLPKLLPAKLYPRLLRQIPDPPRQLYYLSKNTELLEKISGSSFDAPTQLKIICIVGSRNYTEYGKLVCEKIIGSLQGLPIVIVSGLAIGIDALVHRYALKYKIPCIAVPGSGLHKDVLYPRSNIGLANEIIENRGILISELDPEARAAPWTFPLRNRIMAGLSDAVIVIEGAKDSGTMITARMAIEYNREVLAVPGSIFSTYSEGPIKLIKQGAIPLYDRDDLLETLGLKDYMNQYMNPYETNSVTPKLRDACSSEEKSILDILKDPMSADEISYKLNMSISKTLVILSMLEIRGLTEERFGKIYSNFAKNT